MTGRVLPFGPSNPIIQAPMAGGGATPALAAAVSRAGGLGFLAAGYRTAQDVRREIAAVRERTDRPFGVNVFVPDFEAGLGSEAGGAVCGDAAAVGRYRDELAPEAERYGVTLPEAPPGTTTSGTPRSACWWTNGCRWRVSPSAARRPR
ncbi:hypothetical protein GCM10027612_03810 [Microbispora bryophytorum subsp. camponoti]